MAEHRLHARHGVVGALIRTMADESRLMGGAVIDGLRLQPHGCHRAAEMLLPRRAGA